MDVSDFIRRHFRHFNAGTLTAAAEAYRRQVEAGGRMFLAMAGAMSTAELGLSLAEMIRQRKVHAMSCTGANLEEDLYNLIAHDHYHRVPHYRDLSPEEESDFFQKGLNRITDVCIDEKAAMNPIEEAFHEELQRSDDPCFPHEILYRLIRSGHIADRYRIDPNRSWMVAAAQAELPLFVPGWEDSTLGNAFAARVADKRVSHSGLLKSGTDYMVALIDWYRKTSDSSPVGFFQIGGGIAGDFPVCVVPLLKIDLNRPQTPSWNYYCQIGDSTTSYGSYSGASPNEKISWGKLDVGTPRFTIESDATIVAPLIFAYVLGW